MGTTIAHLVEGKAVATRLVTSSSGTSNQHFFRFQKNLRRNCNKKNRAEIALLRFPKTRGKRNGSLSLCTLPVVSVRPRFLHVQPRFASCWCMSLCQWVSDCSWVWVSSLMPALYCFSTMPPSPPSPCYVLSCVSSRSH